MTILRDRLLYEDHNDLLPLYTPTEEQIQHKILHEFDNYTLSNKCIYWMYLYISLTKHDVFMESVRDDDYAADVFFHLRDHTILRKSDGKEVTVGSSRRFGDMLAGWRRCGESYMDFWDDGGNSSILALPPNVPKPTYPAFEHVLDEVGYKSVPMEPL